MKDTLKTILANQNAFCWWLSNRSQGIWMRNIKDAKDIWDLTTQPNWNAPELTYIQDDAYAEVRKARADGKVIQQIQTNSKWEIYEAEHFTGYASNYRVKPPWKWQDELAKSPVLCEVWDSSPDNKSIRFVANYHSSKGYPYECVNGANWRNAEPIDMSKLHEFQRKKIK